MQIALGADAQIEFAMVSNMTQHVVVEADTGLDISGASAIQAEAQLNGGLFGVSRDVGLSRCHG